MRKILCLGVAITVGTSVSAHAAPDDISPNKWQPVIEIEGRTNSDRSIGYPKMLIPLMQSNDALLFTDIRGRLDDQSSQEYNLGLGYRWIDSGWIFGGYAFADHLHSANGFDYWQGTAGIEMLSEDWDIRFNGYLPESTEHTVTAAGPGNFVIDGGGNFGINTLGAVTERALPGFDGEIGYRLPTEAVDLWAFGGFYHFEADAYDDVTGPKARVEVTMKHEHWETIPDGVEFTIGAQFQNDGPRENTTSALAQIRLPLGKSGAYSSKLDRLERRMTNFIERDVDIIAAPAHAASVLETANITINGQTYSGIASTIDGNTSDINGAIAAAGSNSLLLADGSNGVLTVAGSDLHMRAGQALVGGGTILSAVGNVSGQTIDATMPGTRPTIVGSIRIDDIANVAVQGVDINSPFSGLRIAGAGTTNTDIIDVHVISANFNGIDIRDGVDGVTVRDSIIENTGFSGISVFDSANITFDNVVINDAGFDHLRFENTTQASGNLDFNGAGSGCGDAGGNSLVSVAIVGSGTCP